MRRHIHRSCLFFVSLFFIFTYHLSAQNNETSSIIVPMFSQSIKVDGYLDEQVWKTATQIKDFYTYYPVDGQPGRCYPVYYVWVSRWFQIRHAAVWEPGAIRTETGAKNLHRALRAVRRTRISSQDWKMTARCNFAKMEAPGALNLIISYKTPLHKPNLMIN